MKKEGGRKKEVNKGNNDGRQGEVGRKEGQEVTKGWQDGRKKRKAHQKA
jgi:hypothetical protein